MTWTWPWLWGWMALAPFPAISLLPSPWERRPCEEARQLRARWAAGRPGIVLVIGDSLAYGLELAHREQEAYPHLFLAMLQTRFGHPHLRLVNNGVPGRTALRAWQDWERRPLTEPPDLVVLQLGGNDAGQGIPPEEYAAALRALLRHFRPPTPVILALPPLQYEEQRAYREAAQQVAMEEGVPTADFHTALRTPPCDVRGPFPAGAHPRAAAHVRMALELYRAFAQWMGDPPGLWLRPEGPPHWEGWEVSLYSPAPFVQQGHLQWRAGEVEGRKPLYLPPNSWQRAFLPLAFETGTRSLSRRVALAAVTDRCAEFALGEATQAPVFPLPSLSRRSAFEEGGEKGYEVPFGQGQFFLASHPPSKEDLSVAMRLGALAEGFALVISVRDSLLRVRREASPWNDGVELFFDLRPEGERGRPFFDRRCFVLFVAPAREGVLWGSLGDPPFNLGLLQGRTERRPDGYRLCLLLPWQALEGVAGQRLERWGFDVAVDDNDGAGREAQWVWCGDAENYLNPARYGVVERGSLSPSLEVRGFLWSSQGGP